MSARDNYFSKSDLRSRGWTPALIDSLLGKPHWKKPLRGIYSGEEHLYLKESVYTREDSDEFQERLNKFQDLKEKKATRLQRREDEALERAKTIPIKIPQLDKEALIRRAIDHYNSHQLDVWCEYKQFYGEEIKTAEMPEDIERPGSFAERLCVNHIRHWMTKYEAFIQRYKSEAARKIFFERLTEGICLAYPWLTDEAQRQLKERYRDQKEIFAMTGS